MFFYLLKMSLLNNEMINDSYVYIFIIMKNITEKSMGCFS